MEPNETNLDSFQNTCRAPSPSQLLRDRPYRWSDLYKTPLRARLALDREAQHDAFALRYKSYLADGYIDPNPTGLFSDAYDESPTSRTIVVYSGRDAIGSARISTLDVLSAPRAVSTLPASTVFAEEVSEIVRRLPEIGRPKRAVEVARLVRHPAYAKDQGLIFSLFRLVGYTITELDADIVLSCVRPNHVPFYRRMQFEVIAGPRRYYNVKFTAHLLACERSSYGEVRRHVPVLNVSPSLRAAYAGLLRGESVPVSVSLRF